MYTSFLKLINMGRPYMWYHPVCRGWHIWRSWVWQVRY